MFEIVDESSIAEYDSFIREHKKGHFLQSREWAKVKTSWRWAGVISRAENGSITGAVSVLIRKAPGTPYTMMYSARGPVCDPQDGETIGELTKGLEAVAKANNSYTLTMDPDILSENTEFIENMKRAGFIHRPGDKNFDGVQPNYVFRLDIKDKSEDELMQAFHSKTRYNIRLSTRKGVIVKLCGKEALEDFSRIMKETGERDRFMTRPKEYFESILDSLGEDARLYMAFLEDKPIAGTLAIRFGNKVWYLYGASSNEHRNVMPNYQLQWEMIKWALESGCEIYDFRGVSGDLSPENPLYGLYLFKKGFSGDFCEFCGEFEIIYKKAAHTVITKGISTAKKVRSRLVLGKRE